MIKVNVNANNWNGLDQPAAATGGNGLESKPSRPRPSPFPNFHGWGSGAPNKAPKSVPAAPTPSVARKAIDTRSALGTAFKKASDAMVDYVKALENEPQIPEDITNKESKAAEAQSELVTAIVNEADLRRRLNQADNPEHAILDIVRAYVGPGMVDAAREVLFREAAKQALQQVQKNPAPKK
jgi:hypothetical protein